MESDVEVVAGERQVHIRRVRLIRRHEAERLPELPGRREIRGRQAELVEVTTQRHFRRTQGDRRIGARFQHRDRLPEWIAKSDLIENVGLDVTHAECDTPGLEVGNEPGHAGLYEGYGGRGETPLMQPEENPSVGENAVRMRPGVRRGGLAEPELLVEF